MEHVFSQVPKVEVPRSVFDRSHEHKTTIDAGYLYPILVDEILPGDSVVLDTKIFCRMATLIAPIMDNLYLDTFYFFVPERLVWEHFQRMCGEQDDPDDSTDFTFPIFYTYPVDQSKSSPPLPVLASQDVGSLADYFGIPTGVDKIPYVRSEPFRCYNLIWNTWMRDENLQDSVPVPKGDTDEMSNYQLLRRGKRKDYFTSALPFAQKGPGVELPIHGTADLTGVNYRYGYWTMFDGLPDKTDVGSGNYTTTTNDESKLSRISGKIMSIAGTDSKAQVNLSNAVTTTINEFREAFQLQKWLERTARSGSRYTEILRGMFGVVSPDARLQRPEYLGGTSTPIDVNVVPQTASTDATSPQANLSAYAVGVSHNGDGFSKSFVEHGWLIGLVSIRSNYTYQQGINRMWTRRTKYDMYWPSFAHLGEQAILNQEIYAQGVDVQFGDDDVESIIEASEDHGVFGYQERHAEYRYFPSLITGKFRSSYGTSLDYWHLSQYFEELPTLNNDFIVEDPPVDRIIAVPSEPQFLLDCFFNMKCTRPMPLYAVPGLVDHF